MTNTEKTFGEAIDFAERRLDITNPKHRYALIKRHYHENEGSGKDTRINRKNLRYVQIIRRLHSLASAGDENAEPGTYICPVNIWAMERSWEPLHAFRNDSYITTEDEKRQSSK